MLASITNNLLSLSWRSAEPAFCFFAGIASARARKVLTMRSTIAHSVRWTVKSCAFACPLA